MRREGLGASIGLGVENERRCPVQYMYSKFTEKENK